MAVKVKVIQVCFPGAVGAGAPILRALAEAKINILAFCGYTMGAEATLTFVVGPGKEAAAKELLKKIGCKVETYDAVWIEVGNKPGTLAKITEKLAAGKVNINWAYATASGKKSAIVLIVSSAAKALKALA